jgi:hypothetical protein
MKILLGKHLRLPRAAAGGEPINLYSINSLISFLFSHEAHFSLFLNCTAILSAALESNKALETVVSIRAFTAVLLLRVLP